MTETDIAKPVVEYLAKTHDVYQEVPVVMDGQLVSIDVVALRRNQGKRDELIVVECKQSLTASLCDQAIRARPHADYVRVAVSEPSGQSRHHQARKKLLADHGIGLWYVNGGELRMKSIPEYMHNRDCLISDALSEFQQNGPPAGSSGVKRARKDKWDPARKLLRDHGEMTAKELAIWLDWSQVDRLEFVRRARAGEIRGVKADRSAPMRFSYQETM